MKSATFIAHIELLRTFKINDKKPQHAIKMTSWHKWRHIAQRDIKGFPQNMNSDDEIDNVNHGSDIEIGGDSSRESDDDTVTVCPSKCLL